MPSDSSSMSDPVGVVPCLLQSHQLMAATGGTSMVVFYRGLQVKVRQVSTECRAATYTVTAQLTSSHQTVNHPILLYWQSLTSLLLYMPVAHLNARLPTILHRGTCMCCHNAGVGSLIATAHPKILWPLEYSLQYHFRAMFTPQTHGRKSMESTHGCSCRLVHYHLLNVDVRISCNRAWIFPVLFNPSYSAHAASVFASLAPSVHKDS
jgi:hypothetical protein